MNNIHCQSKQTIHGVFIDIFGIGVLLSGKSAVGKSEVALNLITHGHRLIADDSVDLCKVDEKTIIGSCPPVLQDFLEVRGLGILNIRAMFGDAAIKSRKALQLIVELVSMEHAGIEESDRLQGLHRQRTILQLSIPEVTIPVASGRNLATLVEGAVRNEILRAKGYFASEEFLARQRQIMQQQEK